MHAHGLSSVRIAAELKIPRGTVRDWVSGRVPRTLMLGAEYCSACGGPIHAFNELSPSYVYLLGLYLGDGCLATHQRGVYKLRLSLDGAYPSIINEARGAILEVMPTSKVNSLLRLPRYVEVYSYSKAWPCLFPQHGPGKKHLRRIRLSTWQEELTRRAPELLLRGLIHSDGCRFVNTGRGWQHPRYSFTNLSADIRLIFTDTCDLLGLRWTTAGPKVYVSRKADVARMDGFIGPKA